MMRYNTIIFLALGLVAGACSNEERPVPMLPHGTLVLQSIGVQQADNVVAAVGTRAVDASLCIEIKDSEGNIVVQLPAGAPEGNVRIDLPPDEYTLCAFTANHDTQYSGAQLGEPKYYGMQTFTIEDEKVTYCNMTVPMTNAGMALKLPEGFATWFNTYTFTITAGGRTVAIEDGETAYFDIQGTQPTTAICTLTATNTDGEPMAGSTTVDMSAGNIYNIVYEMGF